MWPSGLNVGLNVGSNTKCGFKVGSRWAQCGLKYKMWAQGGLKVGSKWAQGGLNFGLKGGVWVVISGLNKSMFFHDLYCFLIDFMTKLPQM